MMKRWVVTTSLAIGERLTVWLPIVVISHVLEKVSLGDRHSKLRFQAFALVVHNLLVASELGSDADSAEAKDCSVVSFVFFVDGSQPSCVRTECVLPEMIWKPDYHIHQGRFIYYRLPRWSPSPPIGTVERLSSFQIVEGPEAYRGICAAARL